MFLIGQFQVGPPPFLRLVHNEHKPGVQRRITVAVGAWSGGRALKVSVTRHTEGRGRCTATLQLVRLLLFYTQLHKMSIALLL